MKALQRPALIIALFLHSLSPGFSQDTQTLSLGTCEELFLKNNLFLLASQYNISAKQALVIQAKAYPNPVFSADVNMIDPQNKKIFHVDSSGQKAFQVQQLILLGGKRRTEIQIARQNSVLAEAEFSELLRSLHLELTTRFYGINSRRLVIANYQKQLDILDTIIAEYKVQCEKGNLPLKDLIRLKSVYINISSSRAELAALNSEDQKQLKLLVQTTKDIVPEVPEGDFKKYTDVRPLDELQSLATSNRPDLKIVDEHAIIAALILRREKKARIPDLALSVSYDQRGGAFTNQVNAGVSLPVPLLNTNRGNIRAADFDKKSMDAYLREKQLEVELEIQQSWYNMERSIREYKKVTELYNEEFTLVNKGVNDNFHRRNISILEYVDFVEAYNQSLADYEKLKLQLAESAARINYTTATKIY